MSRPCLVLLLVVLILRRRPDVRPFFRPICYSAVSEGKSVVRLSLGKLLVNVKLIGGGHRVPPAGLPIE